MSNRRSSGLSNNQFVAQRVGRAHPHQQRSDAAQVQRRFPVKHNVPTTSHRICNEMEESPKAIPAGLDTYSSERMMTSNPNG
jgi:hypothetical protein